MNQHRCCYCSQFPSKPFTSSYKTLNGQSFFFLQHRNSPLSQELLNSVRRAKFELRRTTGSEPKKLMDVAEYRSFPVGQEKQKRKKIPGNQLFILSWNNISFICQVMNWTGCVEWAGSCSLLDILGHIYNLVLWPVQSAYTYHTHSSFLLVHFERSALLGALFPSAADLTQTLTDHQGGVSLEGIKGTLPLSLLLLSLQAQLSLSKRLSGTKGERAQREKLVEGRKRKEKNESFYSHEVVRFQSSLIRVNV